MQGLDSYLYRIIETYLKTCRFFCSPKNKEEQTEMATEVRRIISHGNPDTARNFQARADNGTHPGSNMENLSKTGQIQQDFQKQDDSKRNF